MGWGWCVKTSATFPPSDLHFTGPSTVPHRCLAGARDVRGRCGAGPAAAGRVPAGSACLRAMIGGSRCAAGELKSNAFSVPLPVITAAMAIASFRCLPGMYARRRAVKCQVIEAGCSSDDRSSTAIYCLPHSYYSFVWILDHLFKEKSSNAVA